MRYLFGFFLLPFVGVAQFAPPAGQAGTTAMYKDSSAFINWAAACRVTRGLEDISNSASGYPTIGDSSKAIGIADNSVVSLGDGGYAICTFQHPLVDGPGPDLAVFENSFSDDYLEFGFVEVSSDGVNYFRFPATSNIQDTAQTSSFGTSDATLVNNLAGKYRGLYGTPFDLQELAGTPGLDINNITHVKIVDAVGSINSAYATYDKNNNKVNDPWPTAFASSGFDLDAVGVIYDVTNSVVEQRDDAVTLHPNPASPNGHLTIRSGKQIDRVEATDSYGRLIHVIAERMADCIKIDMNGFAAGVYTVHLTQGNMAITKKLIIAQ